MNSSPNEVREFLKSALYKDFQEEAQLWYDRALQEQQEYLKEGNMNMSVHHAGVMRSCMEFKNRMFEVLLAFAEDGKDVENGVG